MLAGLPKALRALAALALTASNRREIAYLLELPEGPAAAHHGAQAAPGGAGDRRATELSGLNLDLAYGGCATCCCRRCTGMGRSLPATTPTDFFFWCVAHKSRGRGNGEMYTHRRAPHELAVQFRQIVFYVSDFAARGLLSRTLGISLDRMVGAEPFWLQGRVGHGPDSIFFQQPGKRGDTPAIVFELAEGGIDDVVAELAEKGVNIVTPVSEAPGGWSADFLDPRLWPGALAAGRAPRSLK